MFWALIILLVLFFVNLLIFIVAVALICRDWCQSRRLRKNNLPEKRSKHAWILQSIPVVCIIVFLLMGVWFYTLCPSRTLEDYLESHKNANKDPSPVQRYDDGYCDLHVQELSFTAKADNFDPSNKDTFDQRYFLNDRYFDSAAAKPVVFLYIGGEWTSGKDEICHTTGLMMNVARKHKALVLNLEHRFFGRSHPYFVDGLADSSVETLRLQSPQQAVADIANFIQNFEYLGRNMRDSTWIMFGFSYPGQLCAYMRQKHPDLTAGAVCSSAPLAVKVDYPEFTVINEFVFREWNSTAAENIQKACQEIEQKLETETGRQRLVRMFSFEGEWNLTNAADRYDFAASTCGSLQDVAQSFSADYFDDISEIMTRPLKKHETYIDPLMQLLHYVWGIYTGSNLTDFNTRFDLDDNDGMESANLRNYNWLNCDSAMGLFITTAKNNFLGNVLHLDKQIEEMCGYFGPQYTMEYIQKRTEEFIKEYGTNATFEATNIVLTNAQYDPWSAAGCYLTDRSRNQLSVFIEKATHGSDLFSALERDSPELIQARRTIELAIDFFVESSSCSSSFFCPCNTCLNYYWHTLKWGFQRNHI